MTADTTAILLNFKRPHNMATITKALLATPEVTKVVISNNNPVHRREDLRLPDSDRIEWVEQGRLADRVTTLYEIARAQTTPNFLAVDDDVFLAAQQFSELVGHLRSAPEVPHGVVGQNFDETFGLRNFLAGDDRSVDILNCVYAFNRTHLEEFYRLLDLLGITTFDKRSELGRLGDDIVLSHCGTSRSRCHGLGQFTFCKTWDLEGTAAFTADGYFDYRRDLFDRVRRLKRFA